jgi:hypothetical protein
MRSRVLQCLSISATVAGVAMAMATVRSQAPAPAAKAGASAKTAPAPKTPWGEPDLQGIWTRQFDVPLTRSPKYGNKEFLTDEERATLDKQISGILGRDNAESRRERGTEKDVGGAYNAAIFTSHLKTGQRTSLIVDPIDGTFPPLTPEATKKRAELRAFTLALLQPTEACKNKLPGCAGGSYGPPSPRRNEVPPSYIAAGGGAGGAINRSNGPEDRTLGERCMSGALPDFGGFRRIVQSPGEISMFYDTGQGQGWQRNIEMNGSPHLPANIRQWWGDSRGHWEGNTLVVDVTNFSPKSNFQASDENLHLVERWTRADADTIEYAVTVDDPTVWTKPWTAKQELTKQSDTLNRVYYEPRCYEGNYGLPALLLGTRAQEQAFAEGRGPDPATICATGCGGFAGGFADDGEDSNPLR